MKRIKGTEKLVKQILQEVPETRNSDMMLYCHVCKRIDSSALSKPFIFVLLNLKHFGLPPIGSVGRARRKLQNAFPELAANADVEAQRDVNEGIVKNYAKQVNV